MPTALDYNPVSNPGGQLPYQWTDWQQVFRPQLGAQMQPQSGQPQGPTQSGAPIAPATGSQIIAGRQASRDQVIMNNPLWKAFRPPVQQKGMLANVTEAGSPQEDAQSFFGGVSDTVPQEADPIAVAPTPAPQAAYQPSRSLVTPYGKASVYFDQSGGTAGQNNFFARNNRAPIRLGGGGSKLRF